MANSFHHDEATANCRLGQVSADVISSAADSISGSGNQADGIFVAVDVEKGKFPQDKLLLSEVFQSQSLLMCHTFSGFTGGKTIQPGFWNKPLRAHEQLG